MRSRDKMKMDKVSVCSTSGFYGVKVPLSKKLENGAKEYILEIEKDDDMNQREYGKVCAYVRRALKAYSGE